MEPPNWIQLDVTLPEGYRDWYKQFPPNEIEDVPVPHVTLLYGFDPAVFSQVQADVEAFGLTDADWSFPFPPRPGNLARHAWLLPIHSPRMEQLFWQLHAKYPNQHFLHEGRFEPHVTLCYMTHDIVGSAKVHGLGLCPQAFPTRNPH